MIVRPWRKADFVWMVMLGMLTLLPLPLIIPSLELPFLSASLVFMLVYLWQGNGCYYTLQGLVIYFKGYYTTWELQTARTVGTALDCIPYMKRRALHSSHTTTFTSSCPPASCPRRHCVTRVEQK